MALALSCSPPAATFVYPTGRGRRSSPRLCPMRVTLDLYLGTSDVDFTSRRIRSVRGGQGTLEQGGNGYAPTHFCCYLSAQFEPLAWCIAFMLHEFLCLLNNISTTSQLLCSLALLIYLLEMIFPPRNACHILFSCI
uniref:Uncharacterized protein n=1 Tax=Setaria italica TaxID=4555 RepID=K4AIY1_SETIT